ncbi:Rossmann-like and DUF2520 domain-containing protein [Pedobacter sp. MW01-1-1]|uniref:Rossmann-like and DUF2520 domain-containing protein n=1 Tax=Pedobacter sp. MW01-1-1 TaxID=3383027 RepID=UPI003FF0F1E0
MKIVVLGSGNVATHLAKALQAAGEDVIQIYSPNLINANTLAQELGAVAINQFNQLVQDADLYVIAVKDDAIATVAEKLKDMDGLVVHTSGTTDMHVLTEKVKNAGVFYPLQTFSKAKEVSFSEIPICLEANSTENLEKLKRLAATLSNKVYEVDGEKRKVLHLAAVFACNFTNHLYALANTLLVKNGLSFDIIRPLIAETADKVMIEMPEDVQTGPAIRNDVSTMSKHVAMLAEMPELKNIYESLSKSIKIA